MKSNLPEGWVWTTLGEICSKPQYGWTTKSTSTGSIKYLRTTDITKDTLDWNNVPYCELVPDDVDKYLIEQDDILVSRAGSVGVSYRVKNVPAQTVFASYLIRFKPKGVLPEWVEYFLNTKDYWQSISEAAAGIAVQNVNAAKLSQLRIPLAPLAEQRRIVAQLDAVMQKLEASQERLDKLPDLLKKFRQAVLAAAVSGKLTEAWRAEQPQGETGADLLDHIRAKRRAQWEDKHRAKLSGKQLSFNDSWKSKYEEPTIPDTSELPELPEGWVWGSLDLLSERIVDCPHSTPEFTKEGEYCIDTTCMESGRIRFDKARFVTPSCYLDRISRLEPKEGDVLFAREGTIGTTAMVPPDVKLCLGQRMMMFRPASLVPSYFMWAMISDVFVRQWRPKVMGTTAPHVNIRDLRLMALPVCPLNEQQEIVRQVNHYFELASQLEARFEQAAAMVEQLPQALLAKAFSGQLVPQNPDDEPASSLLERLSAEPAALVKGKRRRKAQVATEAPLFE